MHIISQRLRFGFMASAAYVGLSLSPAMATGYQVGMESIPGAGTAYAGGAAAGLDASTVHSNPAGMSMLDHDELQLGTQIVMPTIHYKDQGSTFFNGAPLTGTNAGNGGKLAVIPDFYWVGRFNEKIHYGVGFTAPWGLVTNYDANWIGRYNEIKTSLRVANLNPSLSYDVTSQLSVGVGFDVQYGIGKLRQAIDFGSACAAQAGAALCSGAFGLSPGNNDGFGKVVGKDWGFGYNVGLLYKPTADFRVGVHYRSKVKLNFDNGKADFKVPANARAFLTVAGLPTAFTNTKAQFSLTIPEQASVSAFYKLDPRWAVMGDVTWTRWSRFDALVISFPGSTTPTNTLQTKWLNTYRASVGTEFYYSGDLTLRAGLAHDRSPIKAAFLGPGIPDSDRTIIATGLSFKIRDNLTADLSYQHYFFKTGGPTRRPSNTGSTMIGIYNVNVDAIGLGFRWAM